MSCRLYTFKKNQNVSLNVNFHELVKDFIWLVTLTGLEIYTADGSIKTESSGQSKEKLQQDTIGEVLRTLSVGRGDKFSRTFRSHLTKYSE